MSDYVNWTPEMEIEFFRAIMVHKPVGADRHFQMICIKTLLDSCRNIGVLTTKQLWEKLDSLYNMEELHEAEINPFQTKVKEFNLPEEFTVLKTQGFPRADSDPSSADKMLHADQGVHSRPSGQKRTRKSLRSGDQPVESSKTSGVSAAKTEPASSGSSTPARKHRRHN